MRSDKFGSQLDRKSKTWFFTFLNVCVSWIFPGPNFWSHSFHLQNSGILQTRMNQRGIPWKWILTILKYKNGCHKLSSRSRWKNGVIYLVSFLPSWVMVLKLPKIVHFLQSCADLSQKSKFLKAIYSYPWNIHKIVFYRGLSNSLRDIGE